MPDKHLPTWATVHLLWGGQFSLNVLSEKEGLFKRATLNTTGLVLADYRYNIVDAMNPQLHCQINSKLAQ